jgi:hypothetical protein
MAGSGKCSGGGRRDDTREVAPLCALLTTLSDTFEVVLVDISATGARFKGVKLPHLGVDLNLAVGRLKAFGTVRWQNQHECGVQFFESLTQVEVMEVRREAANGAGLPPAMRAVMEDWVLWIAR